MQDINDSEAVILCDLSSWFKNGTSRKGSAILIVARKGLEPPTLRV